MPKFPRIAFPTWRSHWTCLDGLPELLTEADAILRRRADGNRAIPSLSHPKGNEDFMRAVLDLRAWAGGNPPTDTAARPQIAREIHALVRPALEAAAWARWLLLERAFLDGSMTGDLLFAALALRTMCEEVQVLHALDLNAGQLAYLASRGEGVDRERLKLFFSFARASLDALPVDTVLYGKDWPSLSFIRQRMLDLESARQKLNVYVHPNYGNHIAALFPERTAAARLLVQTMIVVYKRFFELSWSEKPISGQDASIDIIDRESWPRTVTRFKSETLLALQTAAKDPVLRSVMGLPVTRKWLASDRDDLCELLTEMEGEAPVDGLPRRTGSTSTGGGTPDSYNLWEGSRAQDVLTLAIARQAELRLSAEFPSGAPDNTDQIRWLRFNARSLEVAMMLGQVKEAAFRTQLLRQITVGNTLGILLCVRSLIEIRAFSVWVAREFGLSLGNLAARLQVKNPLPSRDAKSLDECLATFLAFQGKDREEFQESWVMHEDGVARQVRIPGCVQPRQRG